MIDNIELADYTFYSGDKNMSWDGEIFLYLDEQFSKKNWDDKIPVQIKGTVDNCGKTINKRRIQHSANIDDLKCYYRDRGVLYFKIVISDKTKKGVLFYCSLFPTKLKSILDKAERKKNKSKISITLERLDDNPRSLYLILKQFSYESRLQGSGVGQIVTNTITTDKLQELSDIRFTAIGANTMFDTIKRIGSGDISFYGKFQYDSIWFPIEYQSGALYSACEEIYRDITINQQTFYKQYKLICDSDGKVEVVLSENISIRVSDLKVNFKLNGKLSSIFNDVSFIEALSRYHYFSINDNKIDFKSINIDKEMSDLLIFVKNINELFEMIDVKLEVEFNELKDDDFQVLRYMNRIIKGEVKLSGNQKNRIFNMRIQGKYIPLVIQCESNQITIINRIYDSDLSLVAIGDNEEYRVPNISGIPGEILAELYEFNVEDLKKQIQRTDVNIYTADILNECAIELIRAFDITDDVMYIKMAMQCLDMLIIQYPQNPVYLINIYQIKMRQRSFESIDLEKLDNILIKDTDVQLKCCLLILKGKKVEAKRLIDTFDSKEKEKFMSYPIAVLLDNT